MWIDVNGNGWTCDGTAWQNVGPIRGPAGADGAKGDTGATGPKGDKGDPGADGAPGAKGDPGVAGPEGDGWLFGTGAPTAADGDDGDFWYQSVGNFVFWKQNGAWVPVGQLTGAKGDPGADGAPGATGPKGDPGADGAPGPKGDAGATGPAGADGAQGPPGPQAVSTDAGNAIILGSDGKVFAPVSSSGGPDTLGFTFVQDTVPTTTRVGDTWFNTATGLSYVWFDSRWVQFAPGGGGVAAVAPAPPSMEIRGSTHDIGNNTVTTVAPVQTTLAYDESGGAFTYDATITENNRTSLGGIVVPPGVYLVTVDWYVNAKTGVIPVAADAVHVGIGTRQYPSGGLKVSKTSYTARGVISTLQSGEAWTVRTTVARTKIWLDYLETLTLPSPVAAAGAGALSQGKFTLTVTQLRAA
jgi:hypothetical protein